MPRRPRPWRTAAGPLALAARDLKEGRRTHHPELVLFGSWCDLQDYAAYDPAGRDLLPFVDLVDAQGPEVILAAVAELTDETRADVTVSTAHKANGREWSSVKIAGDFPLPEDANHNAARTGDVQSPINDADARLSYVAVAHARHRLNLGGLAWNIFAKKTGSR